MANGKLLRTMVGIILSHRPLAEAQLKPEQTPTGPTHELLALGQPLGFYNGNSSNQKQIR